MIGGSQPEQGQALCLTSGDGALNLDLLSGR